MKLRGYLFLSFLFLLTGCASYQWGFGNQSLPGGYRKVSVPMMVNKTSYTGVEAFFTQSLRSSLSHFSRTIKLVGKESASVSLKGVITSLNVTPTVQATGGGSELFRLPKNAILNTRYKVNVKLSLTLIKNNTGEVLWKRDFQEQELYSAPRLESPVINSANALYNQNARNQAFKTLSQLVSQDIETQLLERL